jgi:hypothetical protein
MNRLFTRDAIDGTTALSEAGDVSVGKSGPVFASLLVRGSAPGIANHVTEIRVYHGIKKIEIHHRLLIDADGLRRGYIAFPFAIDRPRFAYDGPLNIIRPIEDQLAGTTTDYYAIQQWVRMDGEDGLGITWSAREMPIVQLGGNWPDYVSQAHHGVKPHEFHHEFLSDPSELTKGHIYSYIANNNFRTNFPNSQSGVIHASYAITSSMSGDRGSHFGGEFCHPMAHAVLAGRQEGSLPPEGSFLTIDAPNVIVTTVKRSEGLIVRLLETDGADTETTVTVPFVAFDRAVQVNVVEEGGAPLASHGHTFTVPVRAWSLATIELIRAHDSGVSTSKTE